MRTAFAGASHLQTTPRRTKQRRKIADYLPDGFVKQFRTEPFNVPQSIDRAVELWRRSLGKQPSVETA